MVQTSRKSTSWACLVLLAISARLALGETEQPNTDAEPGSSLSPQIASLETSEDFQRLVTALVRENIPVEFVEKDGWGETRERWDGLKVWREGLQIKTKRRKKEVKHGTWKMYRVDLVNPEQYFQIRLEDIHTLPNGRTEFTIRVDAKLKAFARLAQWETGVQLIALSANARADVRLRAICHLGSSLDPSRFPPDVVLDPVVTQTELRLVSYRLERVSQLRGAPAFELGKALREVLERQVAKQQERLPRKLNEQIEKNRDKLRFSVRELFDSEWKGLAASYLGIAPIDDDAPDEPAVPSRPAP